MKIYKLGYQPYIIMIITANKFISWNKIEAIRIEDGSLIYKHWITIIGKNEKIIED